MASFLDLHRDAISGTIEMFDRLIFKGHLNALFPQGAFKRYLDRRGILLKDAGDFFEAETARLKAHAKALADDNGRPFIYLNAAHTHATGTSKESLARRIAEDDGVGLVCAFSTLEPCRSFTVAGNRETKRLEVVRRPRQCLHFYWYLIDPEFGWMHVRLQSWAPYSIQVYVNGREWLARQLDRRGIAYSKSDNKITWVTDGEAARQLCDSFTHTACFLDRLARLVNPLLPDLQQAGFGSYWWVIDQCEYATDLLFKERGVLETVRDDLVAMTGSGASCAPSTASRTRPSPVRSRSTARRGPKAKFRLKANAINFYDHQNYLSIEINNPREFKVLRVIDQNGETQLAPDGQVGGAFLALCPGGRGRQPASDRRPGQRPAHRRGHAGTRRAVPQPGPNPGGALQSGRRAHRPAVHRRALRRVRHHRLAQPRPPGQAVRHRAPGGPGDQTQNPPGLPSDR